MEPMLFRRNAGLERLEWSGCKAGESVVVRGRNRADTWCGVSHSGEQSTSVGSVKPGLSALPARPSCKPGLDIAVGRRRSLATFRFQKGEPRA